MQTERVSQEKIANEGFGCIVRVGAVGAGDLRRRSDGGNRARGRASWAATRPIPRFTEDGGTVESILTSADSISIGFHSSSETGQLRSSSRDMESAGESRVTSPRASYL